jgi:hypothetical protein
MPVKYLVCQIHARALYRVRCPRLRHQRGEGRAVTQQAIQQVVRGGNRAGLRERSGAAGGATFRLPTSTVRASYLERWAAERKPALRQNGSG